MAQIYRSGTLYSPALGQMPLEHNVSGVGHTADKIDLAVDLKVVSKVYVMVPEADKNAKEAENS